VTAAGHGLIDERYRLIEPIASGGMGKVWKAKDELLDREVALKALVPQQFDHEPVAKRRERAINEAQMLARVEHPAIVSVHDLIWVRDDPWIVMNYFRGRSLQHIIDEQPRLDVHEVASIGLPVLHGLVAAHDKGVVHRDIKPANILVAVDGSVCLVDFGIAKAVGKDSTSGLVVGTLDYLAPERLEGLSTGSVKSDLWSFGVTLYHALERVTPFHAATQQATITGILGRDPGNPSRCGTLTDIVLQLLQKEPAKRPDAVAVADELKRVLRGGVRARLAPLPRAEPELPTAKSAQPRGAAPRPLRTPSGGRRGTSLSAMPAADLAAIVSGGATPSGVKTMLELPDTDVARVLDRCDHSVAGKLLGGIAAEQPARAGKILQIIAVDRVGSVFDYIDQNSMAAILAVMPPGEAARILRECELRTASNALASLRPAAAGKLIRAMERERAGDVLRHAAPAIVAGILDVVPADLRQYLLMRLPSQFRVLVRGLM
jgi:tRNA A-37 threonylcarbamoyl transferase component Bud32